MSRPTSTLTGEKARQAIRRGVISVYDPVSRTLGPQGKNALLYRTWNRGSRITNDGYTVAECQEPKDQFARLVNAAFKEACRKTNEVVGDGTTGTIAVAGKLYLDADDLISNGSNSLSHTENGVGVMTLRKNILESAKKIKEAITASAKEIKSLEDLERIATVSVENPELGKIIAKMAMEVGVDGFIDVVEGYKGEIETEVIRGFRFPAKVPAKGFVNNPARFEMIATDCAVLVSNYELDNIRMVKDSIVVPILNEAKISKLIIVAPSFSSQVLEGLYGLCYRDVNGEKVKGTFDIFPVAVPSLREDQYEDLAIYCDAKFINKKKGQKLIGLTAKDLGFLDKLIVKDIEAKEDAVATGGRGAVEQELIVDVKNDKKVKRGKEEITVKEKGTEMKFTSRVAERIAVLKGQLEETQQESFKNLLRRRIASMASAVGIIRVGDSTQASSLYMKLKIEDCVNACKAALRSGYVKGGGLCLKEIADTLPDDDIFKRALLNPYNLIQGSVDGGIEIGPDIIDPAEVPFYAVEHAAGVVGHLVTVDIITVELEDPVHGEGEAMIANALFELAINDKLHKGLIDENEAEMEKDRMKGLTVPEMQALDNG